MTDDISVSKLLSIISHLGSIKTTAYNDIAIVSSSAIGMPYLHCVCQRCVLAEDAINTANIRVKS